MADHLPAPIGRLRETGTSITQEVGEIGETVATVRDAAAIGIEKARYTVEQADPTEVAVWGLGGAAALANPAVASTYSTYSLLGGVMASSSAIGAYVSSHPDSKLAELNPTQVFWAARTGAKSGKHLGSNGSLLGGGLGGVLQAAKDLSPEKTRTWVEGVEVEELLSGVENSHAYLERGDKSPSRAQAAGATAFGLGTGFLRSHVGASETELDDDLQSILDEDLYNDYRAELADGDSDASKSDS